MHLHSSRNPRHTATLSEAIERGLAPDGGLYIPDVLPRVAVSPGPTNELAGIGRQVLAAFFADDPLANSLPDIAREALNFPAPLVALAAAPSTVEVLELFHGPTAAFKDFGARFLSASLQRLR